MATFSLFPILTTFFFSFAYQTAARNTPFQQGVGAAGFYLDLIHRDSPVSPLYDPSRTRLDLITNAFHRSMSRVSSMKKKMTSNAQGDIQSKLYPDSGEYMMEISIGTPPFKTLAVMDTGSDLTWTQCSPCTNCYNQTIPIFNPRNSKSYQTLSCDSTLCSSSGLSDSRCTDKNECEYEVFYGDQSHSEGELSSETFTFDLSSPSVSIEGVAFGCGHNNSGTFSETGSGIVGLGGGPLSIVNQLKSTVNGKFSYCMVPIFSSSNVTSTIYFGSQAIVAGPGTVSTPLVKEFTDVYYFLTLEAIKVANKSLSYKAYTNSKKDGAVEGNIIIDSGTTLTMLPQDFYEGLEKELKGAIAAEPISDPQGTFGLCYNSTSDLKFPTITVSFTGADLDLPGSSTFLEVEEGLVCLTLVPTDDLAIFGNLSQENLLVGYDLVKNQVSFKPTDCTKQ